MPGNGWNRYEERVLGELAALRNDLRSLETSVTSDVRGLDRRISEMQTKEIGEVKVKLAMLEVRSGLIGAIAGSIPALVVVLISLLGGGSG